MPRSHKLLLAALLLAFAALPAHASAAPLTLDQTAVISGTPDLLSELATPVANSFAGAQSISGDGSRVAFSSDSDGLVPGADPDVRNIFVKDMNTGVVTLVSRDDGPNGEPSHTNCDHAVISQDGNRVAFVCDGPLISADDNNRSDVYLRDLTTGRTILVSREPVAGTRGNDDSTQPSLDKDGTHIAFATLATNFGDGAETSNDRRSRIYVRTLGGQDNTPLTLVSRADGANGADVSGSAEAPSISADGSRVAFDTTAPLDANADGNSLNDVYVRDLKAKTTTLVSRASGAGKVGDGESISPLISGDGTVVAFSSRAANLDAHDTSNDLDAYRRFLNGGTTQLVSQTNTGVKGNQDSFATGINHDGSRVAFQTESNNLDPADKTPGGEDIYVNTLQGMMLASRTDGIATPALGTVSEGALSDDGRSVAMELFGGATPDADPRTESVAVRRLDTNTLRTASRPAGAGPFLNQGGFSSNSSVSADGRYVAFTSSAAGLGLPPGVSDGVFVRDTVTGAVVLASRQDGPNGAAMGPNPFTSRISADGRRVVFELNDGTDFGLDSIWVRDIPSGRTFRVDRADGPNGAPANGESFDPTISDDGSRVEFLTAASNLGDGDTDTQIDAHVRDLATGRTLLASRANGAAGAKANADTTSAQISGNGGRVVFATTATNLGDGDATAKSDVHVRDLDSGDTLFVSYGSKGDGDSKEPSISADGTRVSFLSDASFGFDPPGQKLYLRDLVKAGQLIVAGRADGPNGAPVLTRGFDGEQLSADGNSIAFVADADSLFAPGAPTDGSRQAFIRNLTTGATRLVSRRTGTNGTPAPFLGFVDLGGLTAHGDCVVFDSQGRMFAPPASSDFTQIYMRVFKPDCGGRAIGGSVLTAGPDRAAPKLSKAKLSRTRFRVSARSTALRASVGRGTVLSLRVSEASSLTITVDGQRVVRTRKGRRHVLRREGTLVRALRAGSARIPFSGRLGRKRLSVGSHRMTLVARDAAGNVSKRVILRFTVVR